MKEEICVYYEASRLQREREVATGHGLDGTGNFEKIGCYECDGKKRDCETYCPKMD
jgi:hypothetical protein